MFKRFTDRPAPGVTILVDGEPVAAKATDSVAAAMLAAGKLSCRDSVVSGEPRAPHCMMGVCFECLVVVDGVGSRQGCMVRVQDGMRIERQSGKHELGR